MLERYYESPERILTTVNDSPFLTKLWEEYVKTGKGFLAFRNGEATLYIKGVCVASFSCKKETDYRINTRLLPISRSSIHLHESKFPDLITEQEWKDRLGLNIGFYDVLDEITENINKDSGPEDLQACEFYKFSPFSNTYGDWVLIDIEAAFNKSSKDNHLLDINHTDEGNNKRIDAVFFNPKTGGLFFIEVKRKSDPRMKDDETKRQVNRYKELIKKENETIVNSYNALINLLTKMGCGQFGQKSVSKVYLALAITEFSREEQKLELNEKIRQFEEDFPVVFIGNISSMKKGTLNKWERKIVNWK